MRAARTTTEYAAAESGGFQPSYWLPVRDDRHCAQHHWDRRKWIGFFFSVLLACNRMWAASWKKVNQNFVVSLAHTARVESAGVSAVAGHSTDMERENGGNQHKTGTPASCTTTLRICGSRVSSTSLVSLEWCLALSRNGLCRISGPSIFSAFCSLRRSQAEMAPTSSYSARRCGEDHLRFSIMGVPNHQRPT